MSKYLAVTLRGGLGNHLFQLACLYALAKRSQRIPVLESIPRCPHRPQDQISHCYRAFTRPYPRTRLASVIHEPLLRPHVYVDYLTQLPNNLELTTLIGYFQSWRFFHEYESDIVALFGPPAEVAIALNARYQPAEAYFLHYRSYTYRADGPAKDFYFAGLPDYFRRAIAALPDRSRKLLILSDNLAKAREVLTPLLADWPAPVEYVDEDTERSLWLMSLCRGGIGSNSSFSWWGSYLNRTRDPIILPNRWYNDKCRIIGLGDMIFPGVQLLDLKP